MHLKRHRLYALIFVSEALHLRWGTLVCSDPGSGDVRYQVLGTWQHHLQLQCDVSLAQATGVYNTDNCVVTGKHGKGESAVAAWAIGLLSSIPGLVTRDEGRQWWWLEPLVCTHSAAGAYVVVEVTCRHTCSDRDQG